MSSATCKHVFDSYLHIIVWWFAYIVLSHDVSPFLNQKFNDIIVTIEGSYVDRGIGISVCDIHIGPRLDEKLHYL